jgi:hypothetical protein
VLSRLFIVSQLEPGGSGLESGAYLPVWLQAARPGLVGNCRVGQMCWARQVVVKVYGVATTMPQGQSRMPHPWTERQ